MSDTVTINGPGQSLLTIDGNNTSRIFNIDDNDGLLTSLVELRDMTLTGGRAEIGVDGVSGPSPTAGTAGESGGAIRNAEDLTISLLMITGNSAGMGGVGGGGLGAGASGGEGGDGGGIFSSNALTVVSSTLSANHAGAGGAGGGAQNSGGTGGAGGGGGGIANTGSLSVTGSTLSGNDAGVGGGGGGSGGTSGTGGGGGDGGGIASTNNLNFTNSTLSGNNAGVGGTGGDGTNGGAGGNGGNGGGFFSSASLTLAFATVNANGAGTGGIGGTGVSGPNDGPNGSNGSGGGISSVGLGFNNTIVAGSTVGVDVATTGAVGAAFNLVEDGSFTSSNTITGDPLLGPLQDNGGPTQTHALLFGSPAIDAGGSGATTDQRGLARPVDHPTITNAIGGNGSDIGALERQTEFPSLNVTTATDVVDATDFETSLREAINFANSQAGIDTISFDATVFNGEAADVIHLQSGELSISEAVHIDSAALGVVISGDKDGDDTLVAGTYITDAGVNTNTADNTRVLRFTANTGDLTLSGLTLTGGVTVDGGGIVFDSDGLLTLNSSTVSGNNSGQGNGGGIWAISGSVMLTGSTVSGNRTTGNFADGGGIFTRYGAVTLIGSIVSGNRTTGIIADGGGIYARSGNVTLTSSTVSGNSSNDDGGGIYASSGTVTLTSSTVSGNSSNDDGGGIYTASGIVTLTSSTVSGNSSRDKGGGIHTLSSAVTLTSSTVSGNSGRNGGGIFVADTSANPTVTIHNSIVAGNMANVSGPDLRLDPDSSLDFDFSLIGDNTDTTLVEAQTADINGNLIGSSAGGGVINALLLPLANNGGPTQTHFLLTGSPAIDSGNNSLLPADLNDLDGDLDTSEPIPFDQRGSTRILNGTVDIGAVEKDVDTDAPSLIVNTNSDVADFFDGVTSLREAIFFVNNGVGGGSVITFDASLFGQTIQLAGSELAITDSVTINGPGANLLTIDAGGGTDGTIGNGDGHRVFNINSGNSIDVTISGLTLAGGDVSGSGGAITTSRNLTLDQVAVTGNAATGEGGGVRVTNLAQLTVTNSTLDGNQAAVGGGISADLLSIASSTISNNTASDLGGGVFTFSLDATFDQVTVTGNHAGTSSGGIAGNSSNVTLNGTIVAQNTSGGSNPDLSGSSLTLNYSLIGDNAGTTLGEAQTADTNGNLIGGTIGGVINPLLGALADNGGPAQTHALLVGSPAIDAGDPSAVAGQDGVSQFDQRGSGFGRVQSGRIDIGAIEVQATTEPCDFDADGDCDIDDIDAMVMEIAAGTNNLAFDLTSDGLVNLADRDQWLADAGALNLVSGNPYLLGDANLDGTVDGQDFLIWNSNKFQSTGKWSQADWNADGTTDGQDFLIWNSNKFQSADVPVPSLALRRPASHRVRDTALLSLFCSPAEEDKPFQINSGLSVR